jgi:hypothetical protein
MDGGMYIPPSILFSEISTLRSYLTMIEELITHLKWKLDFFGLLLCTHPVLLPPVALANVNMKI